MKISIDSKSKVHDGQKTAQQSVHPTLGILARFQAFFYASAFSQSDGVPPPAPARVTQTVRQFLAKYNQGKSRYKISLSKKFFTVTIQPEQIFYKHWKE
jgi:hypothetical protein